jgi:diguanylate cyclase (GGDEF)-like protein
MSIFIGVYVLFRRQGKKNYFLLMQTMLVVYIFGYLLELTGTNVGEAYAGAKVLYTGASFFAAFLFFFLADYCNIRLHPVFVKIPILLMSLALALVLWTVKFNIPHLIFSPASLYFLLHSFPIICIILSMLMLIYRLREWKEKYRKQLILLLVSLAIPLISESLYFLGIFADINAGRIYFSPYAMALMSLGFCIGIVRFNIFELISITDISAMEHTREGFILVDSNNNYLVSNKAAALMFPGITKLLKGEAVFSDRCWPKELNTTESGIVEFFIRDKNTRHFKASIGPVFSHNKLLLAKIIIFNDVTENVVMMKKLENAAYIDGLTGIYNRKHFYELALVNIERAVRTGQPIYSAMLDLDFFKKVNDNFCHAAGDLVLKKTAAIIRHSIRAYDLLGRYGGEEFVLLITDLNMNEACFQMERIRENIERATMLFEGHEINITCSIGLAKFMENDTLDCSLRKADEALFAAKNAGRNLLKVYGS